MNIFAAGTDSVQRCGYSNQLERKKGPAENPPALLLVQPIWLTAVGLLVWALCWST
jgi:hypothetical protein